MPTVIEELDKIERDVAVYVEGEEVLECFRRLIELARSPWLLLPEMVWTPVLSGEECRTHTVLQIDDGSWVWMEKCLSAAMCWRCESLDAGKAVCRADQIATVRKMFHG